MSTLELHPFPSFFPVETEENIIDQLSDCVPALRSCALTCRAWLPRSRFYLLRSVRIKSEKQLEAFSDMLDKYPNRRSWIASVTMAPTGGKSNPHRLLGAFPTALLANSRNLRRWEVNQSRKGTKARNILYFHNVTLTRLRFSSIEELHLCSVQLGSYAELIRLLIAVVRLGSLKCTNVGFHLVDPPNLDSLKARARRRLLKLSTLMMQDMESNAIIMMLEVAQDALTNLDIFHIKGARWDALPLPQLAGSFPVLSKLSSMTLHWKSKEQGKLNEYLAGVFKSASGLTFDRLRWAPNLQSIGIQLYLENTTFSRTHPEPIRMFLGRTIASMKKQCLALEQALDNLRLKQFLVSLHLSSHQVIQHEPILRRRLEENFPGLHRKGLLVTTIHGDVGRREGHDDSVIALVASPDAKWIASGSLSGHIILWSTEWHPMSVMDEWQGKVSSSQSLSFSPDSHRIVFLTSTNASFLTFHVWHINAPDSSNFLASLRHTSSFLGVGGTKRHVHCAWSRDGSKVSAVAFSHPSRFVSACVWDATTYTLLHVITDKHPLYTKPSALSGTVVEPFVANYFLDDDRLIVVWSPPLHHNASGEITLLRSQNTSTTRIWDLATRTLHPPAPDLDGDPRWSCSVTVTPNQPGYAIICGDKASDWEPTEFRTYFRGERTLPLSIDGLQRLSWSISCFKIWDTLGNRCVATFRCANVVAGCFSPDGLCVGVCIEDSNKGVLQVGRVSDGVLLGSLTYRYLPKGAWSRKDPVVTFSADGKAVYLGTSDGDVHVFHLPFPFPEPNATHDDHTPRWKRCDDEECR